MMKTIASILKDKSHEIYSVAPDATAHDAVAIMAEKGIAAVLVLDSGRLTGIVSAKDYASKIALKERSSKDTLVGEIMTSPVVTVTLDDTVTECIAVMTRLHIRYLPVFDKEELVGVVSLGDLGRAVIADQSFKIDQLMRYMGQK